MGAIIGYKYISHLSVPNNYKIILNQCIVGPYEYTMNKEHCLRSYSFVDDFVISRGRTSVFTNKFDFILLYLRKYDLYASPGYLTPMKPSVQNTLFFLFLSTNLYCWGWECEYLFLDVTLCLWGIFIYNSHICTHPLKPHVLTQVHIF